MESAELQHDSGTESDNYEYPDKVLIKSVTVPETVKRRQPSKHYVCKPVCVQLMFWEGLTDF